MKDVSGQVRKSRESNDVLPQVQARAARRERGLACARTASAIKQKINLNIMRRLKRGSGAKEKETS